MNLPSFSSFFLVRDKAILLCAITDVQTMVEVCQDISQIIKKLYQDVYRLCMVITSESDSPDFSYNCSLTICDNNSSFYSEGISL